MATTDDDSKRRRTALDLDALDGAREGNVWSLYPERLVVVGVDTDHTNRGEHPLYDPRAREPLDEGMVANIMACGVKEPIVGHKVSPTEVEVVDGNRRTMHAREANRRLVKAGGSPMRVRVILEAGEDVDLLFLKSSLNEIRREESPLERARKAKALMDHGKKPSEVALAFGVTAQTVSGWVGVLSAAPQVRDAVESGRIAMSSAAELGKLSRAEQGDRLAELLAEAGPAGRVTAQATAAKVRRARDPAAEPEVPRPTVSHLKKLAALAQGDSTCELSEDFVRGVRWAAGLLPAQKIRGLVAALRAAGIKVGPDEGNDAE